jgi:hypothetical protein
VWDGGSFIKYMTKKKVAKNIQKRNKKEHTDIVTSPDVVTKPLLNLSEIQNVSRSVSDYAAGLSFALPSEGVLNSYASIVEKQRHALDSVLAVGEKLKIESTKVASVLDGAILPLNSTITEIGLVSVSASRLHSLGSIDLQQLQFSNKLSELALDTIQEQQNIISSGIASIEISNAFKSINEITPTLQTISSGISEMMRALPTYPSSVETILPELEIARTDTEIDESDIYEHQTKLDALLKRINPDLVEFRKGAWTAFNGRGDDYIGQASSSMRRLVDQLLREIAPQEEVTKTEFFRNSPKAKNNVGRPTRQARVKFAIKWDQNKSDRLERLSRAFLESYDNLSAWDHHPLKKDSFVHGVLITIEGCLISILSENLE